MLVSGPQSLEIQYAQATEFPERNRGLRAHDRVHRRGHDGQLKTVRVDLPGHRYFFGVAGAPAGHDRYIVERIRPPAALGLPDINVHGTTLCAVVRCLDDCLYVVGVTFLQTG